MTRPAGFAVRIQPVDATAANFGSRARPDIANTKDP